MDHKSLNIFQTLEQRLTPSLELYQKTDYNETVHLWTTRVATLGPYAPGPTWWAREMSEARRTGNHCRISELARYFEQEEKNLSDALLPVVEQLIANRQTRMLLVGFGTGQRVRDYLRLLDRNHGTLHGVDILKACANLVLGELAKAGEAPIHQYEATERYRFQEGLATELTTILEESSYDLVTWERLGNHLVHDDEWKSALCQQAVAMLKPGGHFLLCESLIGNFRGRELNKGRTVNPGSKFRTFDDYRKALEPTMQLNEDLVRETRFDHDDYVIAVFTKNGEPST